MSSHPHKLPHRFLAAAALLLAATLPAQQATDPRPDLVLHGTVTGKQNNTYIENAFTVPHGTYRVTLTLAYTDRDKKTTLDLGIIDPHGVRCWSGGNKSTLTMSASDATPSCLAGPIDAGTWKLLLGVPNIRPSVTSAYTANVFFTRTGLVADEPLVLREPIRTGAAWYRGDLHMHTAHSDGSCTSQTGISVPCPLFFTVDAAARRGLDFIALTDHNATSHYAPMRELAPYFDKLLLIPGREITTFHGHANFYGTQDFLDFRVGTPGVPDTNTLFRRAAALGGLMSINHPGSPTGEVCMGCGWNPDPPIDLKLVGAVEVINSSSGDGPHSGMAFWERGLNAGYHLTAIGGSDNHNGPRALDRIGSVGSPTTVVYATELSTPAILAAIRAGHVFVDLLADPGNARLLEVTATGNGRSAGMGDTLIAPAQTSVHFDVHVKGVEGAKATLIEDGKPVPGSTPATIPVPDANLSFQWTGDGQPHWFRIDIRNAETNRLILLGNPIYSNTQGAATSH